MGSQRRELEQSLRSRLDEGPFRMGQVWVIPQGDGAELRHWEDRTDSKGEVFHDPYDAITLARYDEAGAYRPLKTAPNLRSGWRLHLTEPGEVLLALDFFYPAAWGTHLAWNAGELLPVDLRETLARQSGMYAVVRKIEDTQAEAVMGKVCRGTPGCLRRILWKITPEDPESPPSGEAVSQNEIPLLCAEACNLLIAAGREAVKGQSAGVES